MGGGVLRETNFIWQEYDLIFWPMEVSLVSTRIPCANCSTYVLLYRDTVYSVPNWFQKYCIENKLVTVFLHKALHGISLFPQGPCAPEVSWFKCLSSVAVVQFPFNTVHTLYLCFMVISNKNVDFIFCTKYPMYRIKSS